MPVQLIVNDTIKPFRKRLTLIQRRQLPRASQVAINETLKEARKVAVNLSFPISFALHNRAFPRAAMRIEWADKRRQTGRLYDRFEKPYLEMQAMGGIKRPRGQHLAVPLNVRRTGRGVPLAQRPRTLLAKPNAYIVDLRSGNEAIVEARRDGSLIYRHTLVRQARIPARFSFYTDMNRVAAARFPKHFERALIQALRTAR